MSVAADGSGSGERKTNNNNLDLGPGAVYYQPLFDHTHHDPDDDNTQWPAQDSNRDDEPASSAMKQCSVRSCTQMIPQNSSNKMCDGCREKHRAYASTKRARRRQEKAAMVGAVARKATDDGEENQHAQDGHLKWTHSASTVGHGPNASHSHNPHETPNSSLSAVVWNAIDPRLFAGPPPDLSSSSSHHAHSHHHHQEQQQQHNLQQHHNHLHHLPHPHSTSSELANALILPTPSSSYALASTSNAEFAPANTAAAYDNPYSKYYRVGKRYGTDLPAPVDNADSIAFTSNHLPPLNSVQHHNGYEDSNEEDEDEEEVTSSLNIQEHEPGSYDQSNQHSSTSQSQSTSAPPQATSPTSTIAKTIANAKAKAIKKQTRKSTAVVSPTAAPATNATTASLDSSSTITSDKPEQDGAEQMEGDKSSPEDDADPNAPPRYCSVKGCKKVIPGSYAYKMCPPCRTRYRTYGITKRAKWKAEREAFDKEMSALKDVENEKRKAEGKRSLSECPEELRAWELSIIDEQVPLPPAVALAMAINADSKAAGSPESANGIEEASASPLSSGVAGLQIPGYAVPVDPSQVQMVNSTMYLPSSVDTPFSHSPYLSLNNPLVLGAVQPPLPARMCTVSHCHKILPGYYRYKRCEQHRLQNRYHSKLKRTREKVVKSVGPKNGASVVDIPPEFEGGEQERSVDGGGDGESRKKTKKGKGKRQKQGDDDGDVDDDAGESEDSEDGDREERALFTNEPREIGTSTGGSRGNKLSKKPHDTCAAPECQNLLAPDLRWRHCDECRIAERQRRLAAKIRYMDSLKAKAAQEQHTPGQVVAAVTQQLAPQGQTPGQAPAPPFASVPYGQVLQMHYAPRQVQYALGQQPMQYASAPPITVSSQTPNVQSSVQTIQSETHEDSSMDGGLNNDDALTDGGDTSALDSGIDHEALHNESATKDTAANDVENAASSSTVGAKTVLPATGASDDAPEASNTSSTGVIRAYQPKSATSSVAPALAQNPRYSFTEQANDAAGATSSSTPDAHQPSAKKQRTDNDKERDESISLGTIATALEAAAMSTKLKGKGKGKKKTTAASSSSIYDSTYPIPYSYPPSHPQYPYAYYMPPPYPYGMPQPPPSSSSSSAYPGSHAYPYQPYGYQSVPPGYSYYPPPGYPASPYGSSPMYAPPPGAYPPSASTPYPSSTPYPTSTSYSSPTTGMYSSPPPLVAGMYPQPPPPLPPPHPPSTLPVKFIPPYGYPTSTSSLPTVPAAAKPTTRKTALQDKALKFNGFSYYVNPDDTGTRKRKKAVNNWQEIYEQNQRERTTSASSSTPGPEEHPRPSTSSLSVSQPIHVDETSVSMENGDLTNEEPMDLVQEQSKDNDLQQDPQPVTQPVKNKCVNKGCNRAIPAGVSSTICDKCKLKFKKHQAKAKQRFKLEPRKSLVAVAVKANHAGAVHE